GFPPDLSLGAVFYSSLAVRRFRRLWTELWTIGFTRRFAGAKVCLPSCRQISTSKKVRSRRSVSRAEVSKVLVVDDEPTVRSTLAEAVRTWGYRTVEASTLAETLLMVERERP